MNKKVFTYYYLYHYYYYYYTTTQMDHALDWTKPETLSCVFVSFSLISMICLIGISSETTPPNPLCISKVYNIKQLQTTVDSSVWGSRATAVPRLFRILCGCTVSGPSGLTGPVKHWSPETLVVHRTASLSDQLFCVLQVLLQFDLFRLCPFSTHLGSRWSRAGNPYSASTNTGPPSAQESFTSAKCDSAS